MGLSRATIETLANVLGCRQDQAEDVVHSTASARAAMSRRGFFKAAGAVAAGVVMLDAAPAEAAVDPLAGYTYHIRAYAGYVVVRAWRSELEAWRMPKGQTDYRFQDDTRELMATVTDIDKARGIITVDSAPVRRK